MTTRKAFLSAGGLFMVLVVMLGVLGIVNGLWSKNLVVDGTVSTGDLNADWDCGYTNDDGANFVALRSTCTTLDSTFDETGDDGRDPIDNDWPNFKRPVDLVQKDVGECRLTIGDRNTATGFGNQVAYVEITNAYPSYECTTTLFLSNTGSIPFNLISAEVIQPAGQDALETIDAAGANQCNPSSLANTQVDPGQELQFDCTVHVTQLAGQSTCTGSTDITPGWVVVTESCDPITSYQFAIDVCVAQWNEATDAIACKTSLQHEGPPATTFP